jgi:hypothetical protein
MSKVVVVLGPGRSGTSVMMQLLNAAGVQTPYRLVPADVNNPTGAWEDLEILQLHEDARWGNPWRGFLPLRDEPMAAGERERIRQGVRRIVRERLRLAGDKPWGFKDPRTCFFLPIWNDAFDEFGIKPIFVHCLRSPSDFVASFARAYPKHPDHRFVSLIYFWRTYYGLKHTNLTGYVAHYESWETDFVGQIKGVTDYCGLDLPDDRVEALRQIYRSRRPRSDERQQVVEPMVAELYQQLRNSAGILSPNSELKSFIERTDQLLLQFAPIFDAMYASLDQDDVTRTLLQETRQDAADLRTANALLLQRLDNQAQIEWSEAANEARRARANYEAKQADVAREQLDNKDIYIIGRKVARGVSRGPFHALAALANVYTMRGDIQKNERRPASGAVGRKDRTSRD